MTLMAALIERAIRHTDTLVRDVVAEVMVRVVTATAAWMADVAREGLVWVQRVVTAGCWF